ncbi:MULTISPECIES: hypothetical protein [Algibacter]|uniref:Uncharacterized protein n=1 Tax=Algibacter lectus TaxID=221126 RepID=A0A090VBT6_9FLAO|nr:MULTISPECIES: hypothetical protein [Algibacter]MDO7136132.1 hypothetical protein [Algibacter lectus]MWW23351.1 hypothetical protein [Algibacter lectus]TDY63972.1 hypothetical protein DFQ06_0871 [Algibacter lectus]SFB83246.1 hypothetical protein SAMN04489722_10148 [Algibacter lectus]GAL61528.1 hypothetical protein JCM19300_1351 [Algibacter lectus]
MKQGEEDFKFVKEKNEDKGNYIFQKDKLTRYGFYFVGTVLAIIGIVLFVV